MVLAGRYEHNLDAKGRLIVPARIRQVLTAENPDPLGFWVTSGIHDCLYMFTPKGWEIFERFFSDDPFDLEAATSLASLVYGDAQFCPMDRTGRISLPDFLKVQCGINDKVVLIGIKNRVEVWSPEKREAFEAETRPMRRRLTQEVNERRRGASS